MTREGFLRVSQRLRSCEILEKDFAKIKSENSKLRKFISQKDSIFDCEREAYDKVIVEGEIINQDLRDEYNKLLKYVSIRKRKRLNLKPKE